ncbi:MAG: DUF3137 domain-containing protein [Oscillospiraceae bacterium]|nr:DUF3137 domain-containing protein [Oscillospiraceae bacterium]
MDERYTYIRNKAQEILQTYKAPKPRKSYISQTTLSMIAGFGLVFVGAWRKLPAAFAASGVCFILFIIFLVLACAGDVKQHDGEVQLDRFNKSVLVPQLIREMLPECIIKMNESENLAVSSGLCGGKADTYYDYGTFHFTMTNGIPAVFTRVLSYSYDHSDHTSREQACGALIYFPRVLSNYFDKPVRVFFNRQEFLREKDRRLGIHERFCEPGTKYLARLAEGNIFKNHIDVNNEKFRLYYNAYADDKICGQEYLNDDRAEKLVCLHEEFDSWFSISCTGNDVYLYIRDSLDFVVGTDTDPVIREDLFERFYALIAGSGKMLDYIVG